MTKAAPLIHARTLHCDFNPHLLARPDDFTDSQTLTVAKKIREATTAIDSLTGFRWIVFHAGTHCIAGVVGYIDKLAKKAGAEPAFSQDEKGRRTYAFIGVAIPAGAGQMVPELTYNQLWQWYETYAGKVWEQAVVNTQATAYEDLDTYAEISTPDSGEEICGQTFYETSPAGDEKLFYYYLQQALNGKDVSYCSNLTNLRDVENSSYQAITTTANTKKRFKEGGAKKKQTHTTHIVQAQPEQHDPSRESSLSTGKTGRNYKNYWIVAVVIVLVCILIWVMAK